jgi:hypothetical protein
MSRAAAHHSSRRTKIELVRRPMFLKRAVI